MWTQGLGWGEGVDVGIDGPGLGTGSGFRLIAGQGNCTLNLCERPDRPPLRGSYLQSVPVHPGRRRIRLV